MRKPRKTFRQKLKKSKQKIFVGRALQLEKFQENLNLDPYEDEAYKNIIHVHGQGGVGKTFLLNKFRSISKSKNYETVWVDSEDKTLLEVLAAMNFIAEEFGKNKYPFKQFNKRYKTYLQEKGKLEADPEKPKGTFGKFVKAGLKIGVKVGAETIPGGGMIQELLPTNELANASEEWSNFILKKITNKDEQELVLEPLKVLTPLWIEDLFEVTDKKNVAIFIDTFEMVSPALEKWLIALLNGRYGDIPAILLVIGGRNLLHRERWSAFLPVLSSLPLAPFDDQEAKDYLAQKGIKEQALVDAILSISGKLPVFLSLLSEVESIDPKALADPNEQVVARFLKHIQDPIKRNLALQAALPNTINQDTIECLLPEAEQTKAQDYFEWLKERPFAERRGGHWTYHPVVKEMMTRHLKELSEKKWDQLHQTLATWYASKAQKFEITEEREDWFEDEQWKQLLFEQYFHLLCNNYKKHLPRVIQDFTYLLLIADYASALSLAQLLTQVEQIHLPNNPWGTTLVTGIEGLADEKEEQKEAIRDLFERINQSNWIEEMEHKSAMYYGQGMYAVNTRESIGCYKKAVGIKPDKHEAFNNMGVAYAAQGNNTEAINCYEKAITIKPDYDAAFYNMGVAYYVQGNYAEAINCYEKAITINPDNHAAFNNMGNAYDEQGNYTEAINCYEKAITIKPDYDAAFNNMGNAYAAQGNYAEAINCYKKAVGINSDLHEAFYNMGNVYTAQGNNTEAINCYKNVVGINSDLHEAFYNMGNAYRKQGNNTEAINCYAKAITIKPDYDAAFNNMGNAYAAQGNYAEAINCYKKAVGIKPDKHEAFYNMGNAYRKQGNNTEAINCYAKTITIKPDKHEAFNNMGLAYAAQGNNTEAINCYEKAITINPDLHEAFNNMGNAYYAQGNNTEAINCYAKAITIKPDNDEAINNMGLAYAAQGNNTEAINCYAKAITIKPDKHEAFYNMGNAYRKQGNNTEAINCYKKAVEIKPDDIHSLHSIAWVYLKMWNFKEAEKYLLQSWEQSNHTYSLAPMNLGHVFLLQEGKDQALHWYQQSLELWEDVAVFFEGMTTDFVELRMEERGISKEDYEALLQQLKNAMADKGPEE